MTTKKLFIDSDDDEEDTNLRTETETNIAEEASTNKRSRDDSSDDEDVRRDDDKDDRMNQGNDFDLMMQQKKDENRRHRLQKLKGYLVKLNYFRRKKDIDVINDNDDAIAKMIADMRIAAKEDRDLNDHGRPAIKKIGMLRHVLHNISKVL